MSICIPRRHRNLIGWRVLSGMWMCCTALVGCVAPQDHAGDPALAPQNDMWGSLLYWDSAVRRIGGAAFRFDPLPGMDQPTLGIGFGGGRQSMYPIWSALIWPDGTVRVCCGSFYRKSEGRVGPEIAIFRLTSDERAELSDLQKALMPLLAPMPLHTTLGFYPDDSSSISMCVSTTGEVIKSVTFGAGSYDTWPSSSDPRPLEGQTGRLLDLLGRHVWVARTQPSKPGLPVPP